MFGLPVVHGAFTLVPWRYGTESWPLYPKEDEKFPKKYYATKKESILDHRQESYENLVKRKVDARKLIC